MHVCRYVLHVLLSILIYCTLWMNVSWYKLCVIAHVRQHIRCTDNIYFPLIVNFQFKFMHFNRREDSCPSFGLQPQFRRLGVGRGQGSGDRWSYWCCCLRFLYRSKCSFHPYIHRTGCHCWPSNRKPRISRWPRNCPPSWSSCHADDGGPFHVTAMTYICKTPINQNLYSIQYM